MKKPLMSEHGILELRCKRYAAEQGISLRCPLITSEPQLYEVSGKLIFFGLAMHRAGKMLSKGREVHFIASFEQFKAII